MSRELKFRAWDSGRGVMLVNHTFASIAETGLHKWEGLVWEQFTGLQDKNGTPIFEGDIVCEKFKWEVVFNNGAFWARRQGSGTELLITIIHSRERAKTPIAVVGNIREVKT